MTTKKATTSPLYKQFKDLKAKHPDALILFRCGDFYETYDEDAEDASKILGITLTNRSSLYKEDITKLAGFPYHALDTYLPKLIRAGKRVSICDQMEEPKTIVKRGAEPTETEQPEQPTNKELTDMEQEQVKQQFIGIAIETIKSFNNGIVPMQLNKKLSDAIGTLEYVRLKHQHNGKITNEEMDYVIRLAEIGQKQTA